MDDTNLDGKILMEGPIGRDHKFRLKPFIGNIIKVNISGVDYPEKTYCVLTSYFGSSQEKVIAKDVELFLRQKGLYRSD